MAVVRAAEGDASFNALAAGKMEQSVTGTVTLRLHEALSMAQIDEMHFATATGRIRGLRSGSSWDPGTLKHARPAWLSARGLGR